MPNDGGGRHPFADRSLLVFLALNFVLAFVFLQAWGTYPLYLRDAYGIGERGFGALISLNALLIVLFEMVLIRRVEAKPELSVIAWGGLLIGTGFAMIAFRGGMVLAIASVVVWTIGEMLSLPFASAWMMNRVRGEDVGKAMGLHTLVWGLGSGLSPAVGTWIYAKSSPEALWVLSGLLGVVIFVGCSLLRTRGARARVAGA
jgi:predicted MFS family arabinose efflux permease